MLYALDPAEPGFELHGDIGQDCPGNDIDWGKKSWDECVEECRQNDLCWGVLVTDIDYFESNCWLKTQLCDNPNPLRGGLMFRKVETGDL